MTTPLRVQVSGLRRSKIESETAEKDKLRCFFQQEGCKVRDVSVMVDRKSGKSRGFAFVDFDDADSLLRAEGLDRTSPGAPDLEDSKHGPFTVERQKVTLKVRENTDDTISVPEGHFVFAAFYGDGDAKRSNGKDVTDIVKKLYAEGKDIRASNQLLGDPVRGTQKTLFVDVKVDSDYIRMYYTASPDPQFCRAEDHGLPVQHIPYTVKHTFIDSLVEKEDTETGAKPTAKSFPLKAGAEPKWYADPGRPLQTLRHEQPLTLRHVLAARQKSTIADLFKWWACGTNNR